MTPAMERLLHLPSSPSEEPYLKGNRCKLCGRSFFPRRFICPYCLQLDTMEDIALSRRGKLESYYVGTIAPLGFEPPNVAGYIDLPEGVRVFALITGCEPKEEALKVGMEVELVVDKLRKDEDGNDIIGYKFRPV